MAHSNPPGIGIVPREFWAFLTKYYSPREYVYNWQHYFVSIAASANAKTSANLNVQVPLFAFNFRSKAFITSSGAKPTIPYGIGIALLSGNDWTFGQWESSVITGDDPLASQHADMPFAWPREVPPATQLSITVDNTLNASSVGLTVHAGLVGIECRPRVAPLLDVRPT